ncbi:reticulon-like protein B13 [Citrus sinensis]|uniref:Reticulon-like protein B13 n=1 Tax=Citrus sinensis TaxID=2711 RepID=A0ACB8J1Y2_CITSI|nr:reticulon-like protein B13 [Citrus sinensis]
MDGTAGTEGSSSSSSCSDSVGIARDVFLWSRKNLSFTLLLVSTAIWVLLEVYQFNFLTVASWLAMSIVSFTFLSGNIMRLLGKEPPKLSGLEISEKSALEVANSFRGVVEEFTRWMFHVSVEKEWFVFAQAVAGLLVLSYRCGETAKAKSRRFYEEVDEKVIKKLKSKFVTKDKEEIKEKKIE